MWGNGSSGSLTAKWPLREQCVQFLAQPGWNEAMGCQLTPYADSLKTGIESISRADYYGSIISMSAPGCQEYDEIRILITKLQNTPKIGELIRISV